MSKFIANLINKFRDEGRIADWVPSFGWENAIEYDPLEIFAIACGRTKEELEASGDIKNDICIVRLADDKHDINVTVQYDPEYCEFDYISFEECTHDGTMLFSKELLCTIATKPFGIKTYNKAIAPINFEKDWYKYDLVYIVGPIFVVSEFGHFTNRGWMEQKEIMAMPIKMWFCLREDCCNEQSKKN